MIAAVVAGLAPALKATRPNLVNELKSDVAATQAGGRRWTLRDGLVATQIAVTTGAAGRRGPADAQPRRGAAREHRLPHRRPRHRLDRDEHARLRRHAARRSSTIARSSACARFRASNRLRSPSACRSRSTTTATTCSCPDGRGRTTRGSCSTSRACRRSISPRSAFPSSRAAISRRPIRRSRRASSSSTRRWRASTGRTRTRSASASASPPTTAASWKWSACPRTTRSAPSAKARRRTCTTPSRRGPTAARRSSRARAATPARC